MLWLHLCEINSRKCSVGCQEGIIFASMILLFRAQGEVEVVDKRLARDFPQLQPNQKQQAWLKRGNHQGTAFVRSLSTVGINLTIHTEKPTRHEASEYAKGAVCAASC